MFENKRRRTVAEYLLDWEADVASAKHVVESYRQGIGVGTCAEVADSDTAAEKARRESFD